MFVKKWIQDEFSHGAFVVQEPYQKYSYMVSLIIIFSLWFLHAPLLGPNVQKAIQ